MKSISILLFMCIFINASFAQITRTYDEFEGRTFYKTPVASGYNINPIAAYKTIDKVDTSYSLGLYTYSDVLKSVGNNIIILFSDSSRITASEHINVGYAGSKYTYSTMFTLTSEDVDKIKSKLISKYRLYSVDRTITTSEATTFQNYFLELIGKK